MRKRIAIRVTDKPSLKERIEAMADELKIHGAAESRAQGWPEGWGGKGRFEFWEDEARAIAAELGEIAEFYRKWRAPVRPVTHVELEFWADRLAGKQET